MASSGVGWPIRLCPGAWCSAAQAICRAIPSQVYQFLLEGVLLFVLLWLYARKPRATGQVGAAFLFGYGVFRFIAEFFREPDAHLGLLSLGMSMGQWLCVPMILGGAGLWWWFGRKA
jgi:phosphatidylglycerol---prolipoprotein diacylglyceryl transferase